MKETVHSLLMQLGFSGLEADAYLAVLAEPGATGYRIAQTLGKAAPNVYKAIDSLVVKGALILDDGGGSRTYSAVTVRELTRQAGLRLDSLAGRIEKGLAAMHPPRADEGVYHLNSVHQVMARALEMTKGARVSIVADADAGPMRLLLDSSVSASSRGVKVLLHGREEMDAPGCEVVSSVTEGWPGALLILIVDGSQYLLAFMSRDMQELREAVWSGNALLSACLYRGYMVKALFYRIGMMLGDRGNTIDQVRSELIRLWDVWGYQDTGKTALEQVLKKP